MHKQSYKCLQVQNDLVLDDITQMLKTNTTTTTTTLPFQNAQSIPGQLKHLSSGTADAGTILTKAEGYTGTFITFVAVTTVTPISDYTIDTQTPADIFEIGSTTGVLTLKSGEILDYETSKTHVLEIE